VGAAGNADQEQTRTVKNRLLGPGGRVNRGLTRSFSLEGLSWAGDSRHQVRALCCSTSTHWAAAFTSSAAF
jgi:hypothetical protein